MDTFGLYMNFVSPLSGEHIVSLDTAEVGETTRAEIHRLLLAGGISLQLAVCSSVPRLKDVESWHLKLYMVVMMQRDLQLRSPYIPLEVVPLDVDLLGDVLLEGIL